MSTENQGAAAPRLPAFTEAECKLLAGAARELAMEIASGDVPFFDPWSYCSCAAHFVAIRAGLPNPRGQTAEKIADLQVYEWHDMAAAGDLGFVNLLSEATYLEKNGVPGALVFPLLALADVLDGDAKGTATEGSP